MNASDYSIQVKGISKRYKIGTAQQRADTLRDLITNQIQRMGQSLSRGGRVRKTADTLWALKDVSFDVRQGQALGIIGRNGAGKSTLLKILSRITEPTEGEVRLRGRVGSLLEVGTGFHPELTGRENIYLNGAILGMHKREIERKFDEIVAFAEIEKFLDTPVKHYSSGMYVRLAFAVAAHLEPEILLVDEVLAVGDVEFQKKCLGKMGEVAHEGRAVLFVSHNMEAVVSFCENCMLVEKGQIAFRGSSANAVTKYLDSFIAVSDPLHSHILFAEGPEVAGNDTRITQIETLDNDCKQKGAIYTWDCLVIRIHYHASQDHAHGSFILDIWDNKQQRLAVFDSGLRINIEKGKHYIDCVIPRVPFAAGEYILGAGLAISNNCWLYRNSSMAKLRILGRDVFELGRPPEIKRMIIATEHRWRHGKKDM